ANQILNRVCNRLANRGVARRISRPIPRIFHWGANRLANLASDRGTGRGISRMISRRIPRTIARIDRPEDLQTGYFGTRTWGRAPILLRIVVVNATGRLYATSGLFETSYDFLCQFAF